MYDDLRELAKKSSGDDLEREVYDDTEPDVKRGPFLGMTSAQRFFVSLLIFASVVGIGMACLLLTGKIWLVG
ncbi:MAG: hypothetical protein GTO18_05385 [Anaerolineales bacterium]|nr:hypothetical protein [Anaerolineales bacterium]